MNLIRVSITKVQEKDMRALNRTPRFLRVILSVGILLSAIACEGSRFGAREKGALGGGAAGAGLGAIIGHATGHTGEGIAIGAAAGALMGGLVGNEVDRADDQAAATNQRLDTNDELIQENQRLIEQLKRAGADVRETKRGVVVNLPDVLFQFDKDLLTRDAVVTVGDIGQALREVESRRISVEGHTDSVGTISYNQNLSERRARSVTEELVRNGISRRRLVTRGFGEGDPIASNNTELGRERNRRVEVIVENY